MFWLLDTNHWIQLLKGRCLPLVHRIRTVAPHDIRFCSVVKEELFHGAWKYENRTARIAMLRELFSRHDSVSFDDAAPEEAGRVRHLLEARGLMIGAHDLQIAAIALVYDWTLVTHNTREFHRIDGLRLEDWTRE